MNANHLFVFFVAVFGFIYLYARLQAAHYYREQLDLARREAALNPHPTLENDEPLSRINFAARSEQPETPLRQPSSPIG